MNDLLRIGVITTTHGIRGEVKVFPTTDDPMRFKTLKSCIIESKEGPLTLEIQSVKFFKQFVILKFKGYDNINDIMSFIKQDLMVDRENAVECAPGEYFICDLLGMDVVTDEGQLLGTLTDVLETGANNVYEVTTKQNKQILLPAIPECILEHDKINKKIVVQLMKRLIKF